MGCEDPPVPASECVSRPVLQSLAHKKCFINFECGSLAS